MNWPFFGRNREFVIFLVVNRELEYGRDRELGFFMVVNRESATFLIVNREFMKKVA